MINLKKKKKKKTGYVWSENSKEKNSEYHGGEYSKNPRVRTYIFQG